MLEMLYKLLDIYTYTWVHNTYAKPCQIDRA